MEKVGSDTDTAPENEKCDADTATEDNSLHDGDFINLTKFKRFLFFTCTFPFNINVVQYITTPEVRSLVKILSWDGTKHLKLHGYSFEPS